MERIYRYVLVAVMIALISWGVWYVISHYNKQSTYEDGVLVRIGQEERIVGAGVWEYMHDVKNPEEEEVIDVRKERK